MLNGFIEHNGRKGHNGDIRLVFFRLSSNLYPIVVETEEEAVVWIAFAVMVNVKVV